MRYLWLVGLIAAGIPTASRAGQPDTYILCKSVGWVRTIRVDAVDQGCQTTYTKAGVDRVVGQSKSLRSCRSFLSNIRSNLEKNKWGCRDIKSAQITGPVDRATR
jgi:hypothetical protein